MRTLHLHGRSRRYLSISSRALFEGTFRRLSDLAMNQSRALIILSRQKQPRYTVAEVCQHNCESERKADGMKGQNKLVILRINQSAEQGRRYAIAMQRSLYNFMPVEILISMNPALSPALQPRNRGVSSTGRYCQYSISQAPCPSTTLACIGFS
ncbi:hypothetical protein SISNIDRAFT_457415 [Sistotremastrum niveocremeum HHB9708]|uniref:Uncharacterized protein n=1 Tax=Sistotremastrum niveocremeum HHB9708 TaxID=1314777 RepID=A0A164RQY6_9AGAM|nr:hypothetical protein SISNIDRAFT_457415 [Sistotremastrum niveocremeum HHB9708]